MDEFDSYSIAAIACHCKLIHQLIYATVQHTRDFGKPSFSTYTRDVDLTTVSIMRMAIAIANAASTCFVVMSALSGVLMT